jgi:hypothetical protein
MKDSARWHLLTLIVATGFAAGQFMSRGVKSNKEEEQP